MDIMPNDCNIGRGGIGESKFMFHLLDLTNFSKISTRHKQYVASCDDLTQGTRLTEHTWIIMFGANWR